MASMNHKSAGDGAAIVVRELRRRFGRQQVLDGVNLECPRGQITTIVGPSGCGKTVLLKHLNLLVRPDSGAITIDGVEVTAMGSREQNRMRQFFAEQFDPRVDLSEIDQHSRLQSNICERFPIPPHRMLIARATGVILPGDVRELLLSHRFIVIQR